jgi:hypothetical protein
MAATARTQNNYASFFEEPLRLPSSLLDGSQRHRLGGFRHDGQADRGDGSTT